MTAPTDIATRTATIADAPRLSAFARRVFEATFAADNDPGDMAQYIAAAFTPEAQQRELEDAARTCLLIEHDGAIVAYAMLRTGSSETCVPAAAPVEIERFYVDPAWHGTGLAARLMDAALDTARARGGDVVWLGVWERNPRAIRFYARCGFTDVGAHPFVLGRDVQTDRVMMRALA
jgi:GNAT superfamily N-acetyltransferase